MDVKVIPNPHSSGPHKIVVTQEGVNMVYSIVVGEGLWFIKPASGPTPKALCGRWTEEYMALDTLKKYLRDRTQDVKNKVKHYPKLPK